AHAEHDRDVMIAMAPERPSEIDAVIREADRRASAGEPRQLIASGRRARQDDLSVANLACELAFRREPDVLRVREQGIRNSGEQRCEAPDRRRSVRELDVEMR